MPALAEAINYSGATQTKKRSFNLEKVREFGEAMTYGAGGHFSGHDECNTSLIMMYGCGQSKDLAYWISQDVKNNTKLLKILTTEIAIGGDTEDSDYVFNSARISEYSKESFNDDITNMLTSINECALIDSSESTISLAKRIAAMGNEKVDIERWADKLAGDISKGKD